MEKFKRLKYLSMKVNGLILNVKEKHSIISG